MLWTATDVICIDTKAPHILREDAGRKLLSVKPRADVQQLVIRFVTAGEFNGQFEKLSPDGYTLWGLKDDGNPRAQHFDTLEDLLSMLTSTQPAQA